MGSSFSKSIGTGNNEVEKEAPTFASINTPQIRRLDLDPRSPSSDIPRTPIEVLKTPNTSYTASTAECSTDLNSSSGPGKSTQDPFAELNGTPNVVKSHVHNKILDNARRASFVLTPAPTKLKKSENIVKNLCNTAEAENTTDDLSSLQSCINLENKRASIVGLLETNIDFVETDLDVVIQHKIQEQMEVPYEANQIEPLINEPQENLEDHPVILENVSKTEEILNEPALTDEPPRRSNSIQLYADTKNSVNELSRKLTDLIYQDKELDEQPRVSTPRPGNHTPLKDRNCNNQQRSIPKLKVSDRPTKNALSKIPVIKDKRARGKPTNQCENTPPRMRPKQSEWSVEDSLII